MDKQKRKNQKKGGRGKRLKVGGRITEMKKEKDRGKK